MTGTDALTTIAQVSATLAGFSGIIVAVRQRGLAAWETHHLYMFRLMLLVSLVTVLFALIPFAPYHLGMPEKVTWRVCNGLLGAWLIVQLTIQMTVSAEIRHRLNIVYYLFMRLGNVFFICLVFASAFNLLGLRPVGIYLVGVGWLLMVSALLFFRLVLSPGDPSTK
jgi:hypothetical protein